jgi:serine/threonine protein phosphatase 1
MREGKLDRDIITRNIPNGMGWLLDETPERLIRMALAFLDLPLAIEIAGADGKPESRTGFVHADVPAGLDWDRFTALLEAGHPKAIQAAQWSRRRVDARDASGVAGIARVFLGHTPQSQPVQLGNCFFIDTGGVFRMVNAPYSDHLFLTLADIKAPAGKITAHPNARVDFMAVAARRKPAPKKPGPKKPRPKPPAGPS